MNEIFSYFKDNLSNKKLKKTYLRCFTFFTNFMMVLYIIDIFFLLFLYYLNFFRNEVHPVCFVIFIGISYIFVLTSLKVIKWLKIKSIKKIEKDYLITYSNYNDIFSKEIKKYKTSKLRDKMKDSNSYSKEDIQHMILWLQNDLLIKNNFKVKRVSILSIVVVAIISFMTVSIYEDFLNVYMTLRDQIEKIVSIIAILLLMLFLVFTADININSIYCAIAENKKNKEIEVHSELIIILDTILANFNKSSIT